MTSITINDLLTKNLNDLAEITDNVSPIAGDEYVQRKIMNPLKLLATAVYSPQVKYLGYNYGDPFFTNLQLLLNSATNTNLLGNNVSLIVEVKKQLTIPDMTIYTSRPGTLILSPSKEEFTVTVSASFLDSMNFNNIGLKINSNVSLKNCYINNCKVIATSGVIFSGVTIKNSLISMDDVYISDNNTIYGCEIQAVNSITFDPSYNSSKMYGCYINKIPVNENNNLTHQFNVYVQNL